MTNHISISILYGVSAVTQDDMYRAEHAAQDYFIGHKVDGMAAQSEYKKQWDELDSEDGMTGLALEFIAARTAADLALTQGWVSPDGASCSIEVWTN